jgi:hypothetical protein
MPPVIRADMGAESKLEPLTNELLVRMTLFTGGLGGCCAEGWVVRH